MKVHRLAWIAALLAAAARSAVAHDVPSRAQAPEKATKTVVLVHGFFADGSCWEEVIPLLQQAGVRVVSVQNPLSSLADDVAATEHVIDQQAGPVVLVGHSWGGAVITQAGANPKVASLVYLAAFAPDVGQSLADLLAPYPPPPWLGAVVQDEAGRLTLTTAGYEQYFAPDLPRWRARALAAAQGAAFAGNLEAAISVAAWHNLPTWYVLTETDQMIPPDLERSMATAMGAHVVEARAGHDVLMAQPGTVAQAILAAARGR